MRVTVKQLAVTITTHCTLNCKYCVSHMPEYKKRSLVKHFSLDQLQREINGLFKVYDYIEHITISGGEPLLHPHLAEVCKHVLKFSDKFDDCRVFSNGTIVPNSELVELMKKNPKKFNLVIDDYGPDLSVKLSDIDQVWKKHSLNLRIIKYWGDDQHYGGWVDYGNPEIDRGYSDKELHSLLSRCHVAQYSCPATLDGKLIPCSFAAMGWDLGYFPLGTIASLDAGYVDLLDETVALSEKRKIASTLSTIPFIACRYCNGFDVENSPRILVGEQV